MLVIDVHDPDFIPYQLKSVTVDGEEVINRCFRIELETNGTGRVFLYKTDEQGRFFVDRKLQGPAREVRTGKVVVTQKDQDDDCS